MKICMLQVLHEPFDKRMFHKEGLSLVAAGHDVVSIAPAQESIPDEVDGIRIKTYPMPHGLWQRFKAAMKLIGMGKREPADVYLCPEPESWVSALCIKLMTGRKVVFDIHEPVPDEFAKFFPKFMFAFMRWLTIRFMRLFARYTDHIVLTRDSLGDYFKGLRVPMTTVGNTNRLQPKCDTIEDSLRERYGSTPTIIHQGQFGVYRGAYELLEAMKLVHAEMPEAKCILLGPYIDDEDAYRSAIKEAGLEDTMHLLGSVPFDQVPMYIAVSQVGLILFQPTLRSHAFGMPHKMFDYMREEVPYIAPDFVIEVARITKETECGLLVDVDSPGSIADAILRLLRDPSLAQQLGQNGRRAVESKYNWENDEQRLLAVFDALR